MANQGFEQEIYVLFQSQGDYLGILYIARSVFCPVRYGLAEK